MKAVVNHNYSCFTNDILQSNFPFTCLNTPGGACTRLFPSGSKKVVSVKQLYSDIGTFLSGRTVKVVFGMVFREASSEKRCSLLCRRTWDPSVERSLKRKRAAVNDTDDGASPHCSYLSLRMVT